jgi:hypothetical protein
MPTRLVTVDQLKAILGIGNLYPDVVLEQIADGATDVILDYLQLNRETVIQACCSESIAPPGVGTRVRFRLSEPTKFIFGQSITFGYFPRANWSGRTVVVEEIQDEGRIIIATSTTPWNPGVTDPQPVIPAANVYAADAINFYQGVPAVKEAVTAVAVDMFQSRQAPGGQIEAIDFTPGPYRMGRSLITRVSGLLGRWIDTGSLVG